jgi:thiol-disulfide isomerase/thioredoxin
LRKILLTVAFSVATLTAISGCGNSDEPAVAEDATVTPAPLSTTDHPSFTMVDVNGVERSLDEWSGRPRLLNFWATWCAPCRREIPLLKAMQEAQGEDGVQIIGIAVDFPEEVSAYAEKAQFNYPILVGQEDAMAVAESSGVDFIGMPFTMILSADGELLASHMGEIHQQDLDNIVDVLTQLGRGEIDKAAASEALYSM